MHLAAMQLFTVILNTDATPEHVKARCRTIIAYDLFIRGMTRN